MSSSGSISSFAAARILATAAKDDQKDDEENNLKKAARSTAADASSTATALATVTNSDLKQDASAVQASGNASDTGAWETFAQTGANAPTQSSVESDAETTTIEALTANNRYIRA